MKILIVQTGFIGDVVLSLPVVSNVAKCYPTSEIYVMTTPVASSLMRAHPDVTKVIEFDKRKTQRGLSGFLAVRRELRECNFDIVFSLHKSLRTALLLALSGIPCRFGFREAAGSFLYTKVTPRRHLSHDVLRNLAILENVGFKVEELDKNLTLTLAEDVVGKARTLLGDSSGKSFVGLAPGSVWATKRWTVEGFATVAQALIDEGKKVVLIGSADDVPLAGQIESRVSGELVNLVGQTSLMVSAAVISQCELLVTNDSAPLHLASACHTPIVALFCATVPEFGFGPWQVRNEVLGVEGLSCRPCGRHGKQYCPTGTHACQRQLTAENVLHAIRRISAPADHQIKEAH